jgi:hypothetical protein
MLSHNFIELLTKRAENVSLDVLVSDLTESLSELLGESWEEAYSEAIDLAIIEMANQSTKEKSLDALLKTLTLFLFEFVTPEKQKEIDIVVNSIYSSFKNFYAGSLEIEAKFFSLDEKVIKYLANEGPYWIGNFYNNHLSQRISEIGRAIVLDGSIGIGQSSILMKNALEKEFALTGGPTSFQSELSAPFAGKAQNYIDIISSNAAVKARNYSNIISFDQAEIEVYEFTAVMDNRTSEICQYMNGRKFSTSTAVNLIDRITEADSPEEVKGITPWVSAKEAVNIGGKGNIESQNENLASAGIMMPPLHGL